MKTVLGEAVSIVGWTFWWSALAAFAAALALRLPFVTTYMVAVLTIGPAMAILRGMNRAADPLSPGERAGAEVFALATLLALGSALGLLLR